MVLLFKVIRTLVIQVRMKSMAVVPHGHVIRFSAQQDILNYITMWYNSHRLHSYLDYQSPNDFEKQNNELQKVA